MDWTKYPNFTEAEFRCRHTGAVAMSPEFMSRLQLLRDRFKAPMVITSGYRHPSHPVEAAKLMPGPHSLGRACDVAVHGEAAFLLVMLAMRLGFTGIGVNQKGPLPSRFIHLDDLAWHKKIFRPAIWSY